MKSLLTIFLCTILMIAVSAQKISKADSLLRVLNTTKEDTVKFNVLKRLGRIKLTSDPQAALNYMNRALKMVETKVVDRPLADLYLNIGYCYQYLGNDDSALINLQKCLDVALPKNIDQQVKAGNSIGYILTTKAKYEDASIALFKALNIAENAKRQDLAAIVNSSLSVLYYNQQNYNKAIAYGEKSIEIFKSLNQSESLATGYLNVGLVYADSKDFAKAESYYQEALKFFTASNNQMNIATIYGNLSNLQTTSAEKKISYLLAAQKIWDSVAPEHPNAIGNIGNLGVAYYNASVDSNFSKLKAGEGIVKDKNFLLNKAQELLKVACERCKKIGFDRDLAFFTGILARVEEAKGNYKYANELLHQSTALNDSIYSQENKNKIASIEGEREVAIRDKELAVNKTALSAQRKIRIALIAGVLLLCVIGLMLYRQSRIRKRTNDTLVKLNHELDEANKVKSRFFGIISHDLRSPVANLISFLDLQQADPGLFTAAQTAAHQSAISASAGTLLETMEAMLQWSKSQMQNFTPQIKQVAAATMFDNLKVNFARAKNIEILFFNEENVQINTDPDYLRTIMYNLTSNAAKALQNNEQGKIEWSAKTENGRPVLIIKDNGPGAKENQLRALYAEDANVNSRNGLGLHIIRDLAKAINCVISFSAKEGEGTKFELRFY